MSLTESEAKVLAMLVIGLGSFFIGLLPACFTNRGGERKLFLSSLLCFGAGVLLATSMLHMLPETRETLPLYAELIFCGGFLLLYMVDEIVHLLWGKTIDQPPELRSRQLDTNPRYGFNYGQNPISHGYGHSHTTVRDLPVRHHCRNDLQVAHQASASYTSRTFQAGIFDHMNEPNLKSNISSGVHNNHPSRYGSIPELRTPVPNAPPACCNEEGSLLCHGPHTEPCSNTNTGLAGLIIALTLHAVLEGLAVGLQTETSKVLLLVAAVASHKLVVGFCLGVELGTTAGSFVRHAIAIGVFAGGSAAGIGIGMVVTQIEENWVSNILMPTLQGIAGGSLLYVTVSEVLPRERARWHRTAKRVAGITQFFSVTCGFIFMFILNNYTEAAEVPNGQ